MYLAVDLVQNLIGSLQTTRVGTSDAYSSKLQVPTAHSFQTYETQVVAARVTAVRNLAQPKNISEFLSRSSECLTELRRIVDENSDKVSKANKEALDELDKANESIKRAVARGGDDAGDPGPPDDPWWRKLFNTLKAFREQVGKLSASIGRQLYAVSKAAIAMAWSAFWSGAAPTIVAVIIWLLGGPPPGSFG